MMGYREAVGQELNLGDPFQRVHKLRPLVPRPYLSPPKHNVSNCCLNRFQGLDFYSLNSNNNHPNFGNTLGEEGKEGINTHQVMVSSRWNPTPEQLSTLEELYRCGTRTPSAEQIQHITAQLRRYGKIEGKNVFYWFQNHKARERQKRRRHQLQLPVTSSTTSPPPTHLRDLHDVENIGCKDKGTGATSIGFEVEHKSCKWRPTSTIKETDPPIQSAAGPRKADTSSDGWIQFHESAEFQHNNNHNNNICRKNLLLAEERNATWQGQIIMHPSCTSYSFYPPVSQLPPPPPLPFPLTSSITYCRSQDLNQPPKIVKNNGNGDAVDGNSSGPTSLTLELFPLVKPHNEVEHIDMEKGSKTPPLNTSNADKASSMDSSAFPYYQFL